MDSPIGKREYDNLLSVLFVILAGSPWLTLVALVISYLVISAPWPGAAFYAAVFFPLALLALVPGLRPKARRAKVLISLALASLVLLIPGTILARATENLLVEDPVVPAIALESHGGSLRIKGLSIRWPPDIRRYAPGAGAEFGVEMSVKGGVHGRAVPCTMEDGYGNSVQIQVKRQGVLHLEDQLGGFADIDWTGPVPVLLASRAVGRSASARGPTPLAWHLVSAGEWLVLVTPFIAWSLWTAALAHTGRLCGWVGSADLYLSFLFQTGGLIGFILVLFLMVTGPGAGGDQAMGHAILVIALAFLALGVSLIGLGIMSFLLLSVALQADERRKW